ncbi:hypothetical protein CT676_34075 [Bradyrhizobium sp. MOS001]|uniref:hypothetical protein n=1 Tax=Bradyrhizobium sp. MOS001 TaxID=2133948 RepID=UPI001074E466|nr:hypothetical protein [Bradyrhizobium sp. MOS001]TFW56716.1 hypothetical protein CT676_34075 [Bradyrhizobium sp. MOS001]
MTMLKLMPAELILAAMIAAPAMARDKKAGLTKVDNAYAAASARKHRCAVRAPDEGAYASAPYRKPPCEPIGRTY